MLLAVCVVEASCVPAIARYVPGAYCWMKDAAFAIPNIDVAPDMFRLLEATLTPMEALGPAGPPNLATTIDVPSGSPLPGTDSVAVDVPADPKSLTDPSETLPI